MEMVSRAQGEVISLMVRVVVWVWGYTPTPHPLPPVPPPPPTPSPSHAGGGVGVGCLCLECLPVLVIVDDGDEPTPYEVDDVVRERVRSMMLRGL